MDNLTFAIKGVSDLVHFFNAGEGLLRCGKSCRLRWINYLRPDLKRGRFTEMEEDQIIQLHSRLGNRYNMSFSIVKCGMKKSVIIYI